MSDSPIARRVAAVLAASFVACTTGARAQTSAAGLYPTVSDSAILAELPLRPIGPASMSGRIADIAVATLPGEALGRVIFVGSAAGGVWKSENGGITWKALTDATPISSVGDVTVAPSNPDVVWVGTGESNNLRSSSWGHGVYKSTDGGATWTHMGLRSSQHIARILVHPTNPDIVLVAAMGPLWKSGGERGVYRTTDGGRNWTRVLEVNETTGATDLVFDPTNPNVIYAATMQRERKAYSFVAGGAESGIYKSTDGGVTWRRLTNGLPAGDKGRIGVDVSQSQPRTVYAFVDAQDGGVFRSDDGGESWARQSNINSLPWYTGQVRVDTKNPDRVYHIGQALSVSNDGGKTWERIANGTHADHHAMWISPVDPNNVAIGNDGGFYFSHDRGNTWDFSSNLPVSTFYTVGMDMRDPYYVYGGLQDNGSWGAPVATRRRTGIGNADWINVGGGDGFYTVVDPTDPLVMYSESQNGALQRVDVATDERKSIRPTGSAGEQLRFNWSAPLVVSKYDNRTLYFGANYLFRSPDRGDTWVKLGGDLTRALDYDTLPIMGFHAAGGYRRHDGTAAFGNIATISESPVRQGLLYVGTDDGLIQVSRDDGATWTKIDRLPGVPPLAYISHVVASTNAEGTVYATIDNHRDNDFKPYVLKSTDFGKTWTSISANLPEEGSAQVIREHPRNPNLLFVGTENGLYASTNGGGSWSRIRGGLPTVPVHDLMIHPRENDLVVATHGRGFWILDDVTPLERLAEAGAAAVAQLFPVRPATIFNLASGPASAGDRDFFAPNPPAGALISWVVNRPVPAGSTMRLVITNSAGETVRDMAVRGGAGIHRLAWDLRYGLPEDEPVRPPAVAGDEEEGGFPGFGGPSRGPFVAAGTYTAQLRVVRADGGGEILSRTPIEARRDPLVRLPAAQWAELDDYRSRLFRVQWQANELVGRLEQAKQRSAGGAAAIDSVLNHLRVQPGQGGRGGRGGGFGGFGGRGGAGNQPLLTRAAGIAGQIGSNHFALTAAQKRDVENLEQELARQRTAAQSAMAGGGGALRE
jgi:photosystem II stability/assembly factor-like uncharacterized protein